jgi:hypothetical protein
MKKPVVKSPMKKPVLKKAQAGDTLSKSELAALAHQKRGGPAIDEKRGEFFVKKPGKIKNEVGLLNPGQAKQLREYMDKSSTFEKIYQGLPNVGRLFGKSAADIPKGSKLEKQRDGGKTMTKAKDGKWIQKAIKKPGALRAQLGAKKGEPIPAGKLAAAAKKPGKLGQRARLAQTLKKMKK